jgi:hypothetical protein
VCSTVELGDTCTASNRGNASHHTSPPTALLHRQRLGNQRYQSATRLDPHRSHCDSDTGTTSSHRSPFDSDCGNSRIEESPSPVGAHSYQRFDTSFVGYHRRNRSAAGDGADGRRNVGGSSSTTRPRRIDERGRRCSSHVLRGDPPVDVGDSDRGVQRY